MKKAIFMTITGFKHYYDKKPLEVGRLVKLVKEPDNPYDNEAIAVTLPFIGKIGYVANSGKTVYAGTYSAGRLYDKIDDFAFAYIMFITHCSAIAVLLDKDEVDIDEHGNPVVIEDNTDDDSKDKMMGFKG